MKSIWLSLFLITSLNFWGQNWTTLYGPQSSDAYQWASPYIEEENGNIIIAGMADSISPNGADGFITEIDSNGNILKEIYIGGAYEDRFSLLLKNDSGYLALGTRIDLDNYSYDHYMYTYIQLDSSLNVLSSYADSLSGISKRFTSFKLLNNAYVYGTYCIGTVLYLVKIDLYGGIIWEKSFNNFSQPNFVSLEILEDNNLLLTGDIDYTDYTIDDHFLLKTDTSGNEIWNQTISGPFSRELTGLTMTKDTGMAIVLWDEYDMINFTGGIYRIIKYNKDGIEDWRESPFPDTYTIRSISEYPQGYIMGGGCDINQGYSGCIGKIGYNQIAMPIDTFEIVGFNSVINGFIELQHSQGTILYGGYSLPGWLYSNLFISKIQNDQIVWTTFINEPEDLARIKLTLYPNPTQDFLTISIADNPSKQNAVSIYDLNGKIMYQNSSINASLQLDVSKYPAGAYIVSIMGESVRGKSLFIKK